MTAQFPAVRPTGAALWNEWTRIWMEVILHLGAHRTASTTFQHYVRDQTKELHAQGVGFWGPVRVRKQVFPGLFRNKFAQKGRNLSQRAEGRIRLAASRVEDRGFTHLLISDENLLDTPARSYRETRLYPAAGERTARIAAAFDGRLRRIVLVIRSQELWWASAAAMMLARGHAVPDAERFAAICASRRSWRDIITDVACAAPGAQIEVIPFEVSNGRPDLILRAALERDVLPDGTNRWLNRSADLPALRAMLVERGADPDVLPDTQGRWQPFTEPQLAKLREDYADDLHWLIAGADGLAKLTEDAHLDRAGTSLPADAKTKGLMNDKGHGTQGRMAQNSRS